MASRRAIVSKAALSLLVAAALGAPCASALAATSGTSGTSTSASSNAAAASGDTEVPIGESVSTEGGLWKIDYKTDDFDRPTEDMYLIGSVDGVKKSSSDSIIKNDNTTTFDVSEIGSDDTLSMLALISFDLGCSESMLAELADECEGSSCSAEFSLLASDDTVVSFDTLGFVIDTGLTFIALGQDAQSLLGTLSKGGEAVLRVEFQNGDYSLISIDCTPLPEMIATAFPDFDPDAVEMDGDSASDLSGSSSSASKGRLSSGTGGSVL